MTRHQRRKLAAARAVAASRKAVVRDNLSTPLERVRLRGTLVSPVYAGEGGRARGVGVSPMTHKVTRVLSDKPYAHALGSGATRKTVKRVNDKLITTVTSVRGCGWRVD